MVQSCCEGRNVPLPIETPAVLAVAPSVNDEFVPPDVVETVNVKEVPTVPETDVIKYVIPVLIPIIDPLDVKFRV
jgi:hypothetical protein